VLVYNLKLNLGGLGRKWTPKTPVIMDACRTGEGDNSIAAQFSRNTGAIVIAPDERTWTTPWGYNYDRPYPPLSLDPKSVFNSVPDFRNPGRWHTFIKTGRVHN
jgi:hypothetical protein